MYIVRDFVKEKKKILLQWEQTRFESYLVSSFFGKEVLFLATFCSFSSIAKINKTKQNRSQNKTDHKTFHHVNLPTRTQLPRELRSHGGILCPHHRQRCLAYPRSADDGASQPDEEEPQTNVLGHPCYEAKRNKRGT